MKIFRLNALLIIITSKQWAKYASFPVAEMVGLPDRVVVNTKYLPIDWGRSLVRRPTVDRIHWSSARRHTARWTPSRRRSYRIGRRSCCTGSEWRWRLDSRSMRRCWTSGTDRPPGPCSWRPDGDDETAQSCRWTLLDRRYICRTPCLTGQTDRTGKA